MNDDERRDDSNNSQTQSDGAWLEQEPHRLETVANFWALLVNAQKWWAFDQIN